MNKEKLKSLLAEYNKQDVDNYINYCSKLQTEKWRDWTIKNPRAAYISEEKFSELFKKVANEWLVFDWEQITLQSTGISYSYIALKNKMLLVYPETIFDVQLVYKDDELEFWKTSWVVEYTHKIKNPFAQKDDDIIWAYVVIKNKRWEFLTIMWKEELEKHRKVAKTDFIWRSWYKEMCMKTVVKKATKQHFQDIFEWIEKMDNENYSLENPLDLDIKYKSEIDDINSIDELREYYEKNKGKWKEFDKYISIRKNQILSQ